MDQAFEIQLRRNIEALIAEGKFGEAFEECTKILNKIPNNQTFLSIKRSIEVKMFELNKEKVKEGIKEAKKIFKNKDTIGALKKIRELLTLAPNDATLIRLHGKLQEKYKKETEKAEQDFVQQKEKEFKTLLDASSYSILLQEIDLLESNYIGNKNVMSLASRTKESIIKKEIEGKKELLMSTKFEEIYDFLNDLKNIKKDSKILIDIEASIKKRESGSAMRTIGDFVYSGTNDLETLMKLKKYNEAVSVSEELLQINPQDEKVRKIYNKAKTKAYAVNKNDAIEVIKKSISKLKGEYTNNKSNFIRIY